MSLKYEPVSVPQETFDEKVSDEDFIQHTTRNGNSFGTCRHSVEKMQQRGKVRFRLRSSRTCSV